MIKLKTLLSEVVDGQNYFTEEKFGTIILSQLRKEFPSFAVIELTEVHNGQEFKHNKRRGLRHNRDQKSLADRSAIYNSNLWAVFSIEYNNKEYEARVVNIFKKVPDRELTDKFTMADDELLKRMPFKSLEPKDLNVSSDSMIWKCSVKREDGTSLIPRKTGYAILFDDYKNLREVVSDIKKVIDKDAGFGGDEPLIPSLPTVPNANALHEETSEKIKVPAEPGTVPIPPNYIRLYHYSDETPEELRRTGLLLAKAKGHTYGEPDFVWASTSKPADYKTFVGFAVPIDDKRFARGIGSAPDPAHGADFYNKRGSDFTFLGDIKPSEFIAIHEPWHHTYRYLTDDPENLKGTLRGDHDELLKGNRFPNEKTAILTIKHNYGQS